MKLLTGQHEALHKGLLQFDVWRNEWRRISPGNPRPDCLTCGQHKFETLDVGGHETAAVLCGRDAVQISPAQPTNIDFDQLAAKLRPSGEVNFNEYLLRFRTGDIEVTVFKDARSIIRGIQELSAARSIYARYIGN
jgi:adenylyltransferase/sulfurtransferase